MKIYRTPISKQKLASIPAKERSLFLVVGHISNEMNIYNKLFLWCSTYSTHERVLQKAHSSQSMALAQVLAGKMWEAWTAIENVYFSSKLSKEYHVLLGADAQKSVQQLRKYFNKQKNIVRTIRNKFAFHYDVEQITSGFEIPEHSEDWEIYLTQANGNCLYYAADLAANYALLNSIVPGDLKAAMNQLIEELIQVGGWFTAFLGECMLILGKRYFLDEGNLLVEEFTLSGAPLIKSVNIPYFVETPGSESET